MKRILLLPALCVLALSCQKNEATQTGNEPGETDLSNLVIDQNFNWSSSIKGKLSVNVKHDPGFSAEGTELWVISPEGDRVFRTTVQQDQAEVNLSLPQTGGPYSLYYPATGDRQIISKNEGSLSFEVHTNFVGDFEKLFANANSTAKKSALRIASGPNLLGNADMEINSFIINSFGNNLSVLADNGQWYKLNDNYNWNLVNGSHVFEAQAAKTAMVAQVISVTPTDSFALSADVNGTAYGYLIWIAGDGISSLGYTGYAASGSYLSAQGSVPDSTAYAVVAAFVENTGWIDNVNFSTTPAIIDADGDGVPDSQDNFPNDAARAYAFSYPMAGHQTLAFEDLWPNQGDFDFNDLVIGSKADFSLNSSNELVDAEVSMSLNAVGAGLSNGLAVRFLNANRQPLANSIIASVTGDASTDPANINGLIIFQDAFAAQSSYYTNNGSGPSAIPDTLHFTINFAPGTSLSGLVPDIYIFRTDARGHEVHLDGFSGSAAADASLYNTGDDLNGTYNTVNGLPWALEVISAQGNGFNHPTEKTDILVAYPQFQQWAESSGTQNLQWFLNPAASGVFNMP